MNSRTIEPPLRTIYDRKKIAINGRGDNFTFDLVFDAGHVNVIRVEKFSYNVRLFFFYLLREKLTSIVCLEFCRVVVGTRRKKKLARELLFYRFEKLDERNGRCWAKKSYLRRIIGVSNTRVSVYVIQPRQLDSRVTRRLHVSSSILPPFPEIAFVCPWK